MLGSVSRAMKPDQPLSKDNISLGVAALESAAAAGAVIMARGITAIGQVDDRLLIRGQRLIQRNRSHLIVKLMDKRHLTGRQLKDFEWVRRGKNTGHTVEQAKLAHRVCDRAVP